MSVTNYNPFFSQNSSPKSDDDNINFTFSPHDDVKTRDKLNLSLNERINRASSLIKRLENDEEPPSRPKKKVRRTIFPTSRNEAPTLQIPTSEKSSKETIDESVKQHAFMRMQMFALAVTILHGVATTSKGEKRKISIDLGRAYLQIGKGSDGFHAAHMHTTAGYQDKWREIAIKRIASDKSFTPKTKQILKCKGFTDEDFDQIQKNCYELSDIVKKFNEKWPHEVTRPHSLISGTQLELVLNATTEVKRGVNLFCDKSLEDAIRPHVMKLYKEIMKAEVSREEACQRYCMMIWKHFENLEPMVQQRIAYLKDYLETIASLSHDVDIKNLIKILHALDDIRTKMNEQPQQVLSRSHLDKNEQFLNFAMQHIDSGTEEKIERIRNWIQLRKNDFITEAEKMLRNYEEHWRNIWLEIEGTQMIDFELLFGREDEAKLRKPPNEGFSSPQLKLLKPFTSKA